MVDFQTNGTIVSQVDGGFAVSVISDPTTETPNILRVANNISEVGQVSYTHDLVGSTFTPSTQGVISSLNFSIEVRDPGISSNDTAIHLGLRQNDSIYFFTENGTSRFSFRNANSTTFLSFSKSGIDASDFGFFAGGIITSLDDSLNPDFSASGGLIQFLYGTASGTSGSHPTRTTDFRNSVLTINHASIPGDANSDGVVNLIDLDILGQNYGTVGTATFAQGDFDGDGTVHLLDLDILGANFGATAPVAIPEPASLATCLVGMAGFFLRRRTRVV